MVKEGGPIRNHRGPLTKAVKLLSLMVDAPQGTWGVRELARRANLPPTTVHRGLTHLESEGLIECDPDSGQFRVGLEFYRLAWRAQSQFPIRNVAMRFMKEIVAECNETVFLGLFNPTRMKMIFAAAVDSTHPLRYVVPLNEWVPVYAGASGTAIMAFLPKEERQRIIHRTKLNPLTKNTITDPERLEKELEQIRARGYAYSHGQRITDAVGIAAPIWGQDGHVVGDLTLTIPEQRFSPTEEPKLAQLLIHHAQLITEQLGGQARTQ